MFGRPEGPSSPAFRCSIDPSSSYIYIYLMCDQELYDAKRIDPYNVIYDHIASLKLVLKTMQERTLSRK